LTPVSSFEANTMPPPDFDSRQARRERAYMWHRRWAMPTYEMMKYQVRIAPGLDITEEDVDLLPWAHNRGNKKNLDNAEYHRLQGAELRAFAKKKRSESFDGEDEAAMAAAEAVRRADQEEELRLKALAEAEAAAAVEAAAEAAAAEAAALVEAERLQKEQMAAAAAGKEKECQQAEDAARLRKQAEDSERRRKAAKDAERLRKVGVLVWPFCCG
jgi:hypothetical protein